MAIGSVHRNDKEAEEFSKKIIGRRISLFIAPPRPPEVRKITETHTAHPKKKTHPKKKR